MENEFIEYKKTTSEINEAMISISSMLNKHGKGEVYFGLKNDGSPFKFKINDSTLRDVSRKIFESIKPQIFPDIVVENCDGIDVIKVSFQGNDKPYSAFGKYYIRVADEDRELTPSELRKVMISMEYKENFERIITNEKIDDVDISTFNKFVEMAIESRRLPNDKYEPQYLLKKLNLSSNNFLNNAGRLLFSKNNPITLKMAVFATDSKEIFLDIQTKEGNIIQLINVAIKYVLANIRWNVEQGEDNIRRKEIPEIPLKAIRESIINSFVHARYDIPINHEIGIYSDKIMITNPGSFANEYNPEDFYNNEMSSFLRNELIAKTLFLCQEVESFGSGLRNIYSLCLESNIKIKYKKEETFFSLSFSRNIRNVVTNVVTNVALNENEKIVLNLLSENPSLSANDISMKIDKTPRTAQRIIESLRTKGIIERKGSNKTGCWKVIK